MLALYRLGCQADALEVAHDLRKTLAEGLGLDPSPDARRLQEQILRQDPALEHFAQATRLSPPDLGLVGVPEPEEDTTAWFVGRADVIKMLDLVVQEARKGRGRLVVVDGAAGMGKSAVLDEMTARLQASGGLVLRGGGITAGASRRCGPGCRFFGSWSRPIPP